MSEQESKQIEHFIDIIYRYSRAAIKREISHSINNVLATLSIQQAMLKNSLQSHDVEKAKSRADIIGTALQNLKKLSEENTASAQITPQLKEASINKLILETVEFAKNLTSFTNCKISLDLDDNSDRYPIDKDSIQILVLSFLKTSSLLYSIPIINLQTKKDQESGSLYIYANVKEGEHPVPKREIEMFKSVGPELVQIPLQTVQRIVQSLNKHVELDLTLETEKFGFTCTISLNN